MRRRAGAEGEAGRAVRPQQRAVNDLQHEVGALIQAVDGLGVLQILWPGRRSSVEDD
jgi:hypothetical protein